MKRRELRCMKKKRWVYEEERGKMYEEEKMGVLRG